MSNKNSRSKSPTSFTLEDSILKNIYGNAIWKAKKFNKHVVLKHFSGAKVDDVKHLMKPTQEKSPAQLIFYIGANDLVTNKESNEIENKIVQLANLLKLIKLRWQYRA